MKIIPFTLSLVVTVLLIILLSTSFGSIPHLENF
jgi:hypothetical protein